jgi:hypothetical protein
MLRNQALDAMPRPRYRQDPLPLGSDSPPPELKGVTSIGIKSVSKEAKE